MIPRTVGAYTGLAKMGASENEISREILESTLG